MPGYDIAGSSVPAQLVGGDYFDFIPINDNQLAIILGDVSGKGLPASLLMANLQATLRGQAMLGASAKECVQRSNRLLYQSTSSEKFVTLFYGILDAEKNTLLYSNAGHDAPYVMRKGVDPLRLGEGGLVLSIVEDFPYEEQSVPLGEGDVLVIYSDGISEAINPTQEQFGEERISTVIEAHRSESASKIMSEIIAAVKAHAGAAPQMDDMTLVVVKGTDGH